MKVLVYAPLAVLGHHFETDLEIVENHIASGDEVVFVGCSGELKPLDFYACRGFLRCRHCISRRQDGLAKLSSLRSIREVGLGQLNAVSCTQSLDLKSGEQVKNFQYRGVDIGSAYYSSLISDMANPNPPMERLAETSKDSLELMAGLTERFEELLEHVQPDLVYLFNGRFTIYRPLMRLCRDRGINFYTHERGPSNRMYTLNKNTLPHDIDAKTAEMKAAWTDSRVSREEKIHIGSKWYENRARGIVEAWRSFTDQQKTELLPVGWDDKNYNIAFFASSDNEFNSVPGFEPELFPSQVSAIEFLCEKFKSRAEFQFYVRLHPNLKGLRNDSIKALHNLGERFSNCHIIAPESPVSTYSLVKAARVVMAFTTTVGIEALYWGTPSILLGKSFYMHLEGIVVPKSPMDLVRMLEGRSIPSGSKESAILYGYWAATMGIPFRHYEAMNLTTGRFNGHVITGSRWIMLFSYFSVLCGDLLKVLRGQYGLSHLAEKVRNKLTLVRN